MVAVTTDLERLYSCHVAYPVVGGRTRRSALVHFDEDVRLTLDAVVTFVHATKTVREAEFATQLVFGAPSRSEEASETLSRELSQVSGIDGVRVRESTEGLDFLITVDTELYEAERAIVPLLQSLMERFPDLAIEFMIAPADQIGVEVVTSWGEDLRRPDEA